MSTFPRLVGCVGRVASFQMGRQPCLVSLLKSRVYKTLMYMTLDIMSMFIAYSEATGRLARRLTAAPMVRAQKGVVAVSSCLRVFVADLDCTPAVTQVATRYQRCTPCR